MSTKARVEEQFRTLFADMAKLEIAEATEEGRVKVTLRGETRAGSLELLSLTSVLHLLTGAKISQSSPKQDVAVLKFETTLYLLSSVLEGIINKASKSTTPRSR